MAEKTGYESAQYERLPNLLADIIVESMGREAEERQQGDSDVAHPELWEVRDLPDDLALELHAGDRPALVLVQGKNHVQVELSRVKGLVAALTDAAADLAELLAAGGVYHA